LLRSWEALASNYGTRMFLSRNKAHILDSARAHFAILEALENADGESGRADCCANTPMDLPTEME